MKFRTEIEPLRGIAPIDRCAPMLLLGSCFTSEIGTRLSADGFDTVANPMGPLYNPASIARVVSRALDGRTFTEADLTLHDGIYHCLDFRSSYQSADPGALVDRLNTDFALLAASIRRSPVWIITFGTARVFKLDGSTIVGNCHKLPASRFADSYLSITDIIREWQPLITGRRVIFTVSPIRHVADGLHGNQLSKARLLLAIDELCRSGAEYFPSYEILLDDLRDYRFYAADMKHPSETAVDYIYDIWCETYFSASTRQLAAEARKASRQAAHRPILDQ